jgi:hypothetical protein
MKPMLFVLSRSLGDLGRWLFILFCVQWFVFALVLWCDFSMVCIIVILLSCGLLQVVARGNFETGMAFVNDGGVPLARSQNVSVIQL